MSTRKPIPILPQKGGDDDDAIDALIDRLSCLAGEGVPPRRQGRCAGCGGRCANSAASRRSR